METNEIMVNEEVVEAVEKISEKGSKDFKKNFKAGVIGGLVVVAGGLAMQYVIKPVAAKIRSKKKKNKEIIDDEFEYEDFDEVES